MQILLHDGFQDETVVIFVDGTEVFHKESVKTAMLTGVAEEVNLPDVHGAVRIGISLPQSARSQVVDVVAGDDCYVVFYIEEGELRHVVSDRPFGSA